MLPNFFLIWYHIFFKLLSFLYILIILRQLIFRFQFVNLDDIPYDANTYLPYISATIKRKEPSVKSKGPDRGLTKSQINGVVSIHKNLWWIRLLCRRRRNYRNHGIFPICPKVKVAPGPAVRHMTPNIWKVAADALGKWQIGPGLGVPGEELTKSLAAGRRSLAASPRAKIALRGPPLRHLEEWQKCGAHILQGKYRSTYPIRITAIGHLRPHINLSAK